MGCKVVQLFWKKVWKFLKMLNIELPYDLGIPLLGIHPREIKTYMHTKTYTQMFTAALFRVVPKWKQPKYPSTNEWMIKMWYIHTIKYSVIKRDDVLIHATKWMNSENMLLERSQSQKTTYCMIPFV